MKPNAPVVACVWMYARIEYSGGPVIGSSSAIAIPAWNAEPVRKTALSMLLRLMRVSAVRRLLSEVFLLEKNLLAVDPERVI